MSNGEIIQMNNLESFYPSLYDLFNQTFTQVCGKKYSRITIGSSTDGVYEVNDNFKCIVLVEQNNLIFQDKPFLNRFEKHQFHFKDLLNENENNNANFIYDNLKKIIIPFYEISDSTQNLNKKNKINITSHLVNFSLEEVRAIIYENKGKTFEDIKSIILNKIVPTFSQDIMVNIHYSTKILDEDKEIIKNIYQNKPNNFIDFLNKIREKKISSHQNIIYTFSRFLDLQIEEEMKDVMNKKITESDSEILIFNKINDFYQSKEKNILVFQIKEDLSKHLNHILNLIDIYIKNNSLGDEINESKYIIIIIHLQREVFYQNNKEKDEIIKGKNLISHLSPYNQFFIDNLKGENISITRLYDLRNEILFNTKIISSITSKEKKDNDDYLFNLSKEFKDLIYQAFMRFTYKFVNQNNYNITEANYHEEATKHLKHGNVYLEIIQNAIMKAISEKDFPNYLQKKNINIIPFILIDTDYQQKGIYFFSDIKNYMRKSLLEYFIKFIYKSEKDTVLPSILFSKETIKNESLINYIENLNFQNEKPSYDIRGNTINVIFGLNSPLIYPYLYKIRVLCSSKRNDFFELEIKERAGIIKKKDKENKNSILNDINEKFQEINIFGSNNEEIKQKDIEMFYNDYITIYIFQNIKQNPDEPKRNYESLFKSFLQMKFNEDLKKYIKIGEINFWIECYSDFIIDLLKFSGELGLDKDINNYKEKINEKINERILKDKNNNIIKLSEPFYSIIEYLCIYIFEHSELFNNKIGAIEYFCELIIQDIQECYIESRLIFLLKICVNVYKVLPLETFNLFIQEIQKEIPNFKEMNFKNLKNNWKNEYNLINQYYSDKQDLLISLFVLKIRQIPNDEFRKFMLLEIVKNDNLLPYSQRLFNEFFINISFKINTDLKKKKKPYLIFNDALNNEIVIILEDLIKKQDEKSLLITEILLYIFQINIKIEIDYFESYSHILEKIFKAIDNGIIRKNNDDKKIKLEENLSYVIYPNLTTIYASAFLQKYVKLYVNDIFKKEEKIGNIKEFNKSLSSHKLIYNYIQILIARILYYDYLNKDYKRLKQESENEKYYINSLFEEKTDKDIEELLNNYRINDIHNSNIYTLNFTSNLIDINELKNYCKDKQSDFPVLTSYLSYINIDDIKKNRIKKLKYVSLFNEIENPLLHHFNYVDRKTRKYAKEQRLQNEIIELKSKFDISTKFDTFKTIWNSEFVNFKEINNKKVEINQIKEKTLLEEFLMDDKIGNNGCQLRYIYELFITLQNKFIEEILMNIKNNQKYKNNQEIEYFLKELNQKNEINIQNASKRQIINIKKVDIEHISNFEQLLYSFSRRKCFGNNLKLDYSKYREFEVNYIQIEDYLRKALLYGKTLFSDIKSLNYIIYKSDVTNDLTSDLNKFNLKFGKRELGTEIIEYINNFEDLSNILSSFDQFIFYVNNNIIEENLSLIKIIESSKEIINYSNDFLKLIKELPSLNLKDIVNLYDYIEKKIFPQIKEKAQKQEPMKDFYIISQIEKIFKNKKLITKENLLRAIRKFTIKNLMTNEQVIPKDDPLLDSLLNDGGLWLSWKNDMEEEINNRQKEMDEIKNDLDKTPLVMNTVYFYEVLNEEKIKHKDKNEENDSLDYVI